ncbi:spore germination protein [Alteribacter natronophilus]|uniref:spore germination protein n=1 Tax=Alteribacter natronophilus TaxID=2583810 RepID=UPI001486BBAF|nr:spore germination protein [Alteribacter natronophilus]
MKKKFPEGDEPLDKRDETQKFSSISFPGLTGEFRNNNDVTVDHIRLGGERELEFTLLYSRGLCNMKVLNEDVIPRLEKHLSRGRGLAAYAEKSSIKQVPNQKEAVKKVFLGELVIFDHLEEKVYSASIARYPQRQTEESNAELSFTGPRDGFIEDLESNIALVRKRLKTTSLYYEPFVIGEQSGTRVALLYMNDLAKPEMINHVRGLLENIDVDALLSANQLQELLSESPFRLLPILQTTGRPDFVCNSLLRGRFAILMEGVPVALLGPVTLTTLIKTAEDEDANWLYGSFERLLRITGILTATFLPAFWVALSGYHQDQIPFVLLASVAEARMGVPLPAPAEAILLVLLFELFKEAGLRLPSAIGQILAVVGGIIIGDAAINAGLTNPVMVVVVAISTVATFTLVSPTLQGTVTIFRLFVLISASITGMFGFFVSSYLVLVYAAHLRSFNIPFLAPLAPLDFKDMVLSVFNPSAKLKTRTRKSSILRWGSSERGQGGS